MISYRSLVPGMVLAMATLAVAVDPALARRRGESTSFSSQGEGIGAFQPRPDLSGGRYFGKGNDETFGDLIFSGALTFGQPVTVPCETIQIQCALLRFPLKMRALVLEMKCSMKPVSKTVARSLFASPAR